MLTADRPINDVTGLAETHMSDIDTMYHLQNYSLDTNSYTSDKSGVYLYVEHSYHAQLCIDMSLMTNHIESIFLEITHGNMKCTEKLE